MYAITAVTEGAPPIEEEIDVPEPAPPPVRLDPEPQRGAGEASGDADSPVLSPIERLQPEPHDRRLWVVPNELSTPEKSDIERARERVFARIEERTDSLMMSGEAARDARDWTFTDDQGRRWGTSPAGIHLGGITLPVIPHATNVETAERAAEWNQINRQANRARVRDRFNEQVKAIRERKDQQRGKGGKKGKSGPGSGSS